MLVTLYALNCLLRFLLNDKKLAANMTNVFPSFNIRITVFSQIHHFKVYEVKISNISSTVKMAQYAGHWLSTFFLDWN